MCSIFTHSHHSSLPASVLDEEEDDDDDDEVIGESRDDERSGTKYNVRGRSISRFDYIADSHKVLMVPYNLCSRCYVCSNAANRLVGAPIVLDESP